MAEPSQPPTGSSTDVSDAVRHFHAGNAGWHLHGDGYEDHFHDHGDPLTPEQMAALQDALYRLENVELTTVGVDIGSSTSHLMFAKVHLKRLGDSLSSRFVVVNREVLWRSPILLTPYLPDNRIDAEALGRFIHQGYAAAGLDRSSVDSGAIILTGEALRRSNARAIADLFADQAGRFVCASAGHNMEALMAAHGSGAVDLSRRLGQTVLNVDIGGGTTKFSLIHNGEVLQTAAVAVGGRLVAHSDGRVNRVEPPARQVAQALGIDLQLGAELAAGDGQRLVGQFAEVLMQYMLDLPRSELATELLITDPLRFEVKPQALTFSGGVSEYVYGREETEFGDLGRPLAQELMAAVAAGRLPLPILDPGQGIRATVIGASQFAVQVSGNTITVTDPDVLPLHNLPVVFPRLDLEEEILPDAVASALDQALAQFDLHPGHDPMAVGIRWRGEPIYPRLRALAEGVVQALDHSIEHGMPLVLLVDGDVGNTLGRILRNELDVDSPVLSIDGLDLNEFDYVDLGEIISPANVMPIVIKSLLFSSGTQLAGDHHKEPAAAG